ncbi:hypothetical protein ACJQ40_002742 [Enterococcus faecium]
MKENYEILGSVRAIQKQNDLIKVQLSNEFNDDIPLYITFLSMNVEVLAERIGMPIDEVLKLLKKNIEVEPMVFD